MAKYWFLCTCVLGLAQTAPLEQQEIPYELDSGPLINLSESRTVIFSEEIHVPDVPWLRLQFETAQLGATPSGGSPTVIRITSLLDGADQHLTSHRLQQWRNTSAYFNGDALLIEVIADSAVAAGRLRINKVWAGSYLTNQEKRRSICGPTDDRIPSSDPRSCRVVPIGCSAWIFDDANHNMGTAGHCLTSNFQVAQFQVPLSTSSGSRNHPDPEDQYPVDTSSIQGQNGGTGNDWGYFGCFDNSETGKTPYFAQGVSYSLVDPPATPSGDIRITGYGSTGSGVPGSYNGAQKTHTGPFVTFSGTLLQYATDTSGGNSGSPVIHEDTGLVIGVHTHAGCSSGGGANQGTASTQALWNDALANPLGVCIPVSLRFAYPDGIPEFMPTEGATLRVEIEAQNGMTLQDNTGMLHYDTGAGLTSVAMSQVAPGVYDAVFPTFDDCLSELNFRVSARTSLDEEIFSPQDDQFWQATIANASEEAFADNFETDMGWDVRNDVSLTNGGWERVIPDGDGLTGSPALDGDASGMCFMTGGGPGDTDVDGGHTVLTSPIMDATAIEGEPYLYYYRWYNNQFGDAVDDTMLIEISNDNGGSWVRLEELGPTGNQAFGGWKLQRFKLSDYVTPSDQMLLRFDVSDEGIDSLVEAALDGVRITGYYCEESTPCPADLNGDNTVDSNDLGLAWSYWSDPAQGPDLDNDNRSTIIDIMLLERSYGACP